MTEYAPFPDNEYYPPEVLELCLEELMEHTAERALEKAEASRKQKAWRNS